ncbi:MAG: AAA family ATPase [bacterium]
MSSARRSLDQQIQSALGTHYPLVYIATREEDRVTDALQQSQQQTGASLVSWSAFEGFSDSHDDKSPAQALARISKTQEPTLFLLKDFPAYLEDKLIQRALRDLVRSMERNNCTVIMTYPSIMIPDTLQNEIYLIDLPLPSPREIETLVSSTIANSDTSLKLNTQQQHFVSLAMAGLTLKQVEQLLRKTLQMEAVDQRQLLVEVHREKAQLLKQQPYMEFLPPQHSLNDIGGLDNLKEWIINRRALFSEKTFAAGIPLPSGILFMGVSGCGKSLAAKTISTAWQVPLVRLDMSLVLSGAFGAPEMIFAKATRIAEEIAPVVLWVDEIENSFGYDDRAPGAGNINIFSSFLTWMQEKPASVFLAATANRIEQLPAELMRKGRFDQLFFLDLPNKQERVEILRIHIARQGGDPRQFNLGYLAAATKEWSGAEIEQAVKSARINAYQQEREFTDDDIGMAAGHMVPLSHTMKEQIKAIKEWTYNRAVPASRKTTV